MSLHRRIQVEELRLWAKTSGLASKRVGKNNIMWVNMPDIKDVEGILSAESIPYLLYGDGSSTIYKLTLKPDVKLTKVIRSNLIETLLRGFENRVADFKNGITFKGDRIGFVADFEKSLTTSFMNDLKGQLSEIDKNLLQSFDESVSDLIRMVNEWQ
jgi:hypothetical protein